MRSAASVAVALDAARPRSAGNSLGWSCAVFGVALAGMVGIYHRLWADPATSTLGSIHHTNDPMQMMWFLKWVPWQLIHGHNPFTTDALFYPHGVALTWNTLVPTLGILAAPITLTAGPAVSFAVLITLGPALTALSAFWWLRRHTAHPAAAMAGGLLIGFSPFASGHMLGHLNLVFTPLLPLQLILVEDLLSGSRPPRPARRTGCYLGVVAALQLGISEELELITVVAVVIALALGCATSYRGIIVDAVRQRWRALALAVAVLLVCAAPLLISQLVLSPPVRVRPGSLRTGVNDYLYSLGAQLVRQRHWHHSLLGAAEDGVFLGWAVIAVLLVGFGLTLRRDPLVRIAAATLIVLVALTFGSGDGVRAWLPWSLLGRLPALESVIPARFAFASFLVVGWLIARWLDQLATLGARGPAWRRAGAAVAAAAMLASLVTLVPRAIGSYRLPQHAGFFGSARERALLPPRSPVLLLPSPSPGDASGMYYQQQADFRFLQTGGYALVPAGGPRGAGAELQALNAQALAPQGPPPAAADLARGRTGMCHLRLRAILVVRSAPQSQRLLTLARDLAGRPPDLVSGGVALWLLHPPSECS